MQSIKDVQKYAKQIRFWYSVFLGVFTVVVGILFIVQAAIIYYDGISPDHVGDIYSREIVGKHLSYIAVPVWMWVAFVIVGAILFAVLHAEEKKLPPYKNDYKTLARLRARVPADRAGALQKSQNIRLYVRIGAAAFCLLSAIMSAVYLFNSSHFPSENLNAEILKMLRHVLPWIAASFVVVVGVAIFEGISVKRELDSVKTVLKETGGGVKPAPAEEVTVGFKGFLNKVNKALHTERARLVARIIVGTVAVVFIGVGIWNGGMGDVLIKAINICTECIGLG
ncbi:MAG: hypothetical protein K2L87_04345 [Clostridiales bacterium]|nr:hypothetical protein [Clostridiales bacterium]